MDRFVIEIEMEANRIDIMDANYPKKDIVDTELCKAVMKGSLEDVMKLIGNDLHILRGVTPQGNTALHVAAARGHHELVQLLLEQKPCMLLMTNSKGETALHKAAASPALNVVHVLLKFKFDTEMHCNSSGCVHDIDLEACGRYPQLIWRAQNKKGETALHYASKGGFLEIVVELLSVEGIASIVNNAGESALYTACEEGNLEVATRLLEEDPPVPATRKDGTSCLHAVIHLLPRTGTVAGRLLTPVHLLVRASQDLARELLSKRRELAETVDTSGNVPLHLATLAGDLHLQLVEDLLKVGPDMNFRRNNDKMAPIHIAAMHGYLKISKLLVESAPHCTDLVGKDGKNALQLALQHGHSSLALRFLLPYSVDPIFLINEPDSKGNTALHEEAEALCRPPYMTWNRRSVLEPLLRTSLWSVNAVNDKGDTPLDVLISSKSVLAPVGLPGLQTLIRAGGVFKGKGNLVKISETLRETSSSGAPKDASETVSIIAGLIATVTFAAAFTIPGGENQETGIPVLMHKAALQVFIICDTVSMCLSMASLFLLIYFPSVLRYCHSTTITKRSRLFLEITSALGTDLIICALLPTMAAFAAGIYVVVAPKCLWLALTVCSIVSATILLIMVWGARLSAFI